MQRKIRLLNPAVSPVVFLAVAVAVVVAVVAGSTRVSPISKAQAEPVRPEEISLAEGDQGLTIEQVSLGWTYSAAVATDGSLWMWGGNSAGQL